jgi:hypothetical protein
MLMPRFLTPAVLAVALFAAPAFAQLKPPASGFAAPAAPSAPAASAPAAAAAPDTKAKEQEASIAAQGWLVLLDRKDWGRAWETTGSVFRRNVPLGSWMDAIPKLREPLGELVARTPVETAYKTSLQGQPDGEYVTVVFDSNFANKEVTEVVTTVREADGKWHVTGYRPQ